MLKFTWISCKFWRWFRIWSSKSTHLTNIFLLKMNGIVKNLHAKKRVSKVKKWFWKRWLPKNLDSEKYHFTRNVFFRILFTKYTKFTWNETLFCDKKILFTLIFSTDEMKWTLFGFDLLIYCLCFYEISDVSLQMVSFLSK